MNLFVRRLFPAFVTRSVRATPFRCSSSDVPIGKGPYWDPSIVYPGPYAYIRPVMDLYGERQREYLQNMDRILRMSPMRRLPKTKSMEGRRNQPGDSAEKDLQSDFKCVTVKEDKLELEVEMNMASYDPEDIFVNQTGDWLIINAQHAVRADKYGYITRQLIRQIYLPEGLNKETIKGQFTEEGNLLLSCKAVDEEGFKKLVKIIGKEDECSPGGPLSESDPCGGKSPCGETGVRSGSPCN